MHVWCRRYQMRTDASAILVVHLCFCVYRRTPVMSVHWRSISSPQHKYCMASKNREDGGNEGRGSKEGEKEMGRKQWGGEKPRLLRWRAAERVGDKGKRWGERGGGGGWGAGRREWLRDKRGVSECECVCVMSGWPQGAVDSLCCSAAVLTGSGPFALSLAPPLHSLQKGQG